MTPLPAATRSRPARPEILAESPPAADVWVGPRTLMITVSVPQIHGDDLDAFFTRTTLRLRSRTKAGGVSYCVPLPVAVEPERYVLRRKNGVLDIVVERSH